jgi:mannose-6-phosphate isomerase-like protein (cupin superfamily)
MKSVSAKTAERYRWGNQCDGWHLIRSDALSVIQERMPPGTSEVRHYHAKARQFFFVLSGQLSIAVEAEIHLLGAEDGLEIAPEAPHRVFNAAVGEARFLVVSSPPAQGDRVPCSEEENDGRSRRVFD